MNALLILALVAFGATGATPGPLHHSAIAAPAVQAAPAAPQAPRPATKPTPPEPPDAPPPPRPAGNEKPAPPEPPAAPPRKMTPGPNVRVDVTLTEVADSGTSVIKTVSVTTTNFNWGKLRSQVTSRAYGVTPLNVDVRPEVLSDGNVSLQVAIEYSQGRNPDAENNPDRIQGNMINQSATLLLESGKPLTMSQSADPVGARKVSVEVKATVLH